MRLLITFWIGGRGLEDARRMLKDLTVRSQGKPCPSALFVSDELPHYGTVLGELFHKLVTQTPMGKPGRPRNSDRIIDADARSMHWLKAKFAICVACYNLIRPHETLCRGEDRIFRPKNPAIAAGVMDHQWTFSELLAYPALYQ